MLQFVNVFSLKLVGGFHELSILFNEINSFLKALYLTSQKIVNLPGSFHNNLGYRFINTGGDPARGEIVSRHLMPVNGIKEPYEFHISKLRR